MSWSIRTFDPAGFGYNQAGPVHACHSPPRAGTVYERPPKSWLQLYVDAMTERDPYKRLTLVRELRQLPKEKEPDEFLDSVLDEKSRKISKREIHTPKSRRSKKALGRKLRSGA